MNLELLKKSRQIIFEIITGSNAYGTNTPESDLDIRGIFRQPLEARMSLDPLINQVSDKGQDITYYELKKYFELASDCNPNIIEMLYPPKETLLYVHPIMQKVLDNRHLFISKKAKHTFAGYAMAQIKRCRGQNKWINNPKPERAPQREDFCWVISMLPEDYRLLEDAPPWNDLRREALIGKNIFPMRPVPVVETNFNLSECVVAKLEHVENTYRLYYYGPDGVKGVFRDNQLVTESIPKEDEWENFVGFLIYNEQAYNKAKDDHKNYWTWKKERNESRYAPQEAGELDYDAKNVMHTFRLLWSGLNILENGEPIVRFEGERLEFLMDIRTGKFEHDELMEQSEKMMANLDALYNNSTIPESVDKKAINDLYMEVIQMDIDERKKHRSGGMLARMS
jgi:predicted nucleotidyltransferase